MAAAPGDARGEFLASTNVITPALKAFGCTLLMAFLWACADDSSSEAHLELARTSLAQADPSTAIIELKTAIQKDPENGEARLLLGELYLQLGELLSAEKELQLARSLGVPDERVIPLIAQVMLPLGQTDALQELPVDSLPGEAQAGVLATMGLAALMETGTPEQSLVNNAANASQANAIKLIKDALSHDPDSRYARVAQARIYTAQGDIEPARRLLDGVLEENPADASAWGLLGDIEQISGAYRLSRKAYTNAIAHSLDPMQYYFRRARLALKMDDLVRAQADLNKLNKRTPKHPGVNYLQGLIHYSHQDWALAATAFGLAQTDSERYPAALLYAGIAQHRLGKLQQAETYIKRYLQLEPDSTPGRRLLALIKLQQRAYATAEELARTLLELNPADTTMMNVLAHALMAQGRNGEAIELLEQIVELDPQSANAKLKLGTSMLANDQQQAGVAQLEAAIAQDDQSERADIILVLSFIRGENYKQALAAADDYRKRYPLSSVPHNLIGRIHESTEREQEAVTAYSKVLALEPGDPTANRALARLAEQRGEFSAAESFLQAILAERPDYLPAMLNLAELAGKQGDDALMTAQLEAAIKAHPKAVKPRVILARYYISHGRVDEVAGLLRTVNDDNKSAPVVLRELGIAKLLQHDFSGAVSYFSQLTGLTPNDPEAHLLLARAYAGQNNAVLTLKAVDRAIEIQPDHLDARLFRAQATLLTRDLKATEEDTAILEKLVPDHPDVLTLRGTLAQENGKQAMALDRFSRAFKIDPQSHRMLALSRQYLAGGDVATAQALEESWLETHPDDVDVRLALASTYTRQQKIKEGVVQYEAVLALEPQNFLALNTLAWAVRVVDPERAVELAKRAVLARPNSAEALDTVAMAQVSNGQAQLAWRNIERALVYRPDDLTLQYHSSIIALENKDLAAARSVLNEIFKDGRDFPEKQQALALLARLISNPAQNSETVDN